MAIPALSTADKLFICSYNIGSNIDHRKALGNINKITTFTNEYIDGFCWIPVNATTTDNNHSWWWDLPDKDTVYVEVGVRVAADGYIHTWLLNTQKVSDLVLWNNNYNTTNQPSDDTTALHLCIEKMYRVIFGNTTSFVAANIKFQNYITGGSRLYLFGNYSNSLTHRAGYSGGGGTVVKSGISWYPNNSTTILSDFLYTSDIVWSCWIRRAYSDADGWVSFNYIECDKAFLDDGGSFTDYTTEFGNNELNDVPLMPATEAVNDAFYYGSSDKFDIISLNIETAGVGTAITWEYWNGSSWTSLSVTDGTSGFTVSGVNEVSFTKPTSWATTTVNGSDLYWVRSRVSTASFTTQPIASNGTIRSSSVIWSKAREPIFIKSEEDHITEPISSHCVPGSGATKEVTYCYDWLGLTCTGDQSGRSYPMWFTVTTPPGCGDFVCDQISVTNIKYKIDEEPNRAYVWVPGACSDPAYGNQTDCETAGETWTPGHYVCDPSFTYDTSVTFNYGKFTTISATEIDYVNSRAKFSIAEDIKVWVDYSYPTTPIEIFNEYGGDLDQLKRLAGANIDANSIYTIFTKHVAFGLLVGSVDLVLTSDWKITWGAADYFSGWSAPDGLAGRTPGTPNTPYTRPITHHDEFNVVSGEPVLGGILYDLLTSAGFNSRDPGVETKILYPVENGFDFDFVYGLATSDAFLNRDPGVETKILYPVCDSADFNFLYELLTSNSFLSRDPGTEVLLLHPVCDNSDFSFLYKLIEPPFAVLYHLKTDGDDTKDGLSWPNAWKHWSHMAQNLPNERTVLVKPGTYSGETQIGLTNSGIVFLVDINGVDNPAIVTVILV